RQTSLVFHYRCFCGGRHRVWFGTDGAHYPAAVEFCAAVDRRGDWHGTKPGMGTQTGGGASDFTLHGHALLRGVTVPDVAEPGIQRPRDAYRGPARVWDQPAVEHPY